MRQEGDGEHRSRIEMAGPHGHPKWTDKPGPFWTRHRFTTNLEKVKFLLLILKSASGILVA